MKFRAEEDLVKILKQKLKEIYSRETIEILEEVSLGYGIADIVICDISKKVIEVKSTSKTSLTRTDINVYNLINKNQKITLDSIIEITKISKKSALYTLKRLIERGLVTKNDNYFSILNKYQLTFRNNIAVEAKLKDWKRALHQAYRYKWFADYCFVVMDAHYSQPAIENLNLFIKHNIGLATINTNGKFQRIYNPKRQNPFDPTMQILLSEKIMNDYKVLK